MIDYLRPRFVEQLNEDGNIIISNYQWTRYDILEGMIKEGGANDAFSEWLREYKSSSIERCAEFLRETECLDRFKELNHRLQHGSVLPFVGAGMSIPCGFKSWGPFLLSLLADAPQQRPQVQKMLSEGKFEEAATFIEQLLGSDAFAEEIDSKLGEHHERLEGPVNLLPELFITGCLTTNFDLVLTKLYGNAGKPFRGEYAGARLRDAARRIATEPHCLMRLHGVAMERTGRVLTSEEYASAYASNGLDQTLERLIGNRSLLFLGCSLNADKTHNALKLIKERGNGSQAKHYAVLPLPTGEERIARRQFLSEADIHPIYYPPDDHDGSIEALLMALLDGGFDD